MRCFLATYDDFERLTTKEISLSTMATLYEDYAYYGYEKLTDTNVEYHTTELVSSLTQRVTGSTGITPSGHIVQSGGVFVGAAFSAFDTATQENLPSGEYTKYNVSIRVIDESYGEIVTKEIILSYLCQYVGSGKDYFIFIGKCEIYNN